MDDKSVNIENGKWKSFMHNYIFALQKSTALQLTFSGEE